ncbi:MAG: hypothetical protein WDN04_14725 [Rhodospirillales bacterium]
MLGDIVGHRGKQFVARGTGKLRAAFQQAGQYFNIHFVVRGIDAGGIVDSIGIQMPAGQGEFNPASLGKPEIGAFAHHFHAQLVAVDADRVVGFVTGIGVGFAAGLHVAADAAEIEQFPRARAGWRA